ncbi:hypothetical protein, partial [Kaistella sp.]|uniref:hypothetical protein n=1 Tax=Kaistella sp. TaxID=2782235 RepID=UPI002F93238F
RGQASPKSWLRVETANVPEVPEKRYLMNNVHFFSANVLTTPFKSKDWELKASASYTNNAIERTDSKTEIYEPGSSIVPSGGTYVSESANHFYTNASKGELIFTKNAKKGFFKNTTTWNGSWNDTNATINNFLPPVGGSNTPINKFGNQFLDSPSGIFQNSLSTILPWKEKLFNVMSYVSYQKDRQAMDILPASYVNANGNFPEANQFEKLRQNASSETFTANHSASVGFSYKKWTFTPEMGLNLNFNTLESLLTGSNGMNYIGLGQSFQNDTEWNEIQPYTQLGVNFKSNSFNLSLNLPFNFYDITYRDNLRNNSLHTTKSVLEPSLFASLDFASFFKIWAFASQNNDFGNFGFLYEGKMLTSPLGITQRYSYESPMIMPEYRNSNLGSRLEYRNPLNNLFFNVRYGYSVNKRNLIEKFSGDGFNSSLTLLALENTSETQTESAEIGKYFPKFKTNASVSFSNADSKSFSFFNQLQESKINRQNMGVKFNNTYFSWLSVDYSATLNWATQRNASQNTENKTSGWNHNLAAYIYPLENHTIGFFWDEINTKSRNQSFNNAFYDLSYQYTWAKKKIDFEIKWLNIANTNVFERITYDPQFLLTTVNSIRIRSSQVMFTVKFNFK